MSIPQSTAFMRIFRTGKCNVKSFTRCILQWLPELWRQCRTWSIAPSFPVQLLCITCPLWNILIREGITDFLQEFVLWLPSFHSLRGDNRSTLHLSKCSKKSSQSIQYIVSIKTQFEIQLQIKGQSQTDTNCNIEMPSILFAKLFQNRVGGYEFLWAQVLHEQSNIQINGHQSQGEIKVNIQWVHFPIFAEKLC